MLIFVEGIDKTGKDTLVRYINELTNYKHCVLTRGPLSTTAYAYKYKRNDYDDSYIRTVRHSLIVFLTASIEDLNIRFKLTNEPEINKDEDKKLFDATAKALRQRYGLKILNFDTSKLTPYIIAKKIKNYLEEEEKNGKKRKYKSFKTKNGYKL